MKVLSHFVLLVKEKAIVFLLSQGIVREKSGNFKPDVLYKPCFCPRFISSSIHSDFTYLNVFPPHVINGFWHIFGLGGKPCGLKRLGKGLWGRFSWWGRDPQRHHR